MATFAFASDIHLEALGEYDTECNVLKHVLTDETHGADAFVLCGDIVEARLLAAPEASSKYQIRQNAIMLFDALSAAYPNVIYIMGNHEHYHGTFESTKTVIENATAHLSNFHVLENDSMKIADTMVFGATFWTDAGGPVNEWFVQQGMNDYRLIKTSVPSYRKLRVSDTVRQHARSSTCLREFLDQNSAEKVAVFTHHAPHFNMIEERYRLQTNNHLNYAYYSDQVKLIEKHDNLLLWLSGHTHARKHIQIGNTITASNSLGYYPYEINANDIRQFVPKVIKI